MSYLEHFPDRDKLPNALRICLNVLFYPVGSMTSNIYVIVGITSSCLSAYFTGQPEYDKLAMRQAPESIIALLSTCSLSSFSNIFSSSVYYIRSAHTYCCIQTKEDSAYSILAKNLLFPMNLWTSFNIRTCSFYWQYLFLIGILRALVPIKTTMFIYSSYSSDLPKAVKTSS